MDSTSMESERALRKENADAKIDLSKMTFQALFLIVIQIQKLYQMRYNRLGLLKQNALGRERFLLILENY
jgi:hypothetical protein